MLFLPMLLLLPGGLLACQITYSPSDRHLPLSTAGVEGWIVPADWDNLACLPSCLPACAVGRSWDTTHCHCRIIGSMLSKPPSAPLTGLLAKQQAVRAGPKQTRHE